MTKAEALTRLRAREGELRALGIEHVSIFGSTARNEATAQSDLDLAIKLRPDLQLGWDFFSLDKRVGSLLGVDVDLVTEPTAHIRLQAEIDRDRVDAF